MHRRTLADVLALTLLLAASPAPVAGSVWPVTDGPVHRIVPHGDRVYLAGAFRNVGLPARNFATVSSTTGSVLRDFEVQGTLQTIVPDDAGGWYLGGYVTMVQNVVRMHLAHVDAAGNVTSWSPSANGEVDAIVKAGSTVYVGGAFTTINGQPRNHLAALDAATGDLLPWNPNANRDVYALALDGNTLYVGGWFTSVGGQVRNHIAAVDASSGAVAGWNPNATDIVTKLIVTASNVYAAGAFTGVGDALRGKVAQLDRTTGFATDWNPQVTGILVRTLTLDGSRLYLGGDFTHVGGVWRRSVAAVDAITGELLPWNPFPAHESYSPEIRSIAPHDGVVYLGGRFTSIGGYTRFGLGAVDATTSATTPWVANASSGMWAEAGQVRQIVPTGSGIVVAGAFRMVGHERGCAAAIDLATREVLAWNPGANGAVYDLVPDGASVYLAGTFTAVGGVGRSRFAEVDATTGATRPWNPALGGLSVRTLELHEGALHLGGDFWIGSGTRVNAAAYDLATHELTGWTPNANLPVNDMVVDADRWYQGGEFTSIGGRPREHVAVTDEATGEAVAGWNPGAAGRVEALAIDGGTLYLGGYFTTAAGIPRNNVAAVDAATGALTGWNPNAFGGVNALLPANGSVYLGGVFTAIGGVSRLGLARVDATSGVVDAWQPVQSGTAWIIDLALHEDLLFVGGDLRAARIFGEDRDHFAVISTDATVGVPEPGIAGARLQLSIVPNPVRRASRVRFVLPVAATVSLTLYDVAGRAVERRVQDRAMEAGAHELSFESRALEPGVYLARLSAGGVSETYRFVVLE